MKKLVLAIVLLLGFVIESESQNYEKKWSEKDEAHYVYVNGSLDLNMLLGIKNNIDTAEFDDRGLDWDFEVGVRYRHFGIYLFYGQFIELQYQNYGAGVDYYVEWLRNTDVFIKNPFSGRRLHILKGIEMSAGVAYGSIARQQLTGTEWERKGSTSGNHIRIVSTFWIGENIGITGRFQFTEAGDLPNKTFRKEGAVGVTIKFNRG